ncbi:telomere-protecting terminal protein Tpg [Streptomyces salyersiae]|uniref:telomere-protecting terminal protein Tpg n=1 Tax=Streptomyces salyersiae TaxID=3075530 RepID=UPI00374E144C
MRRPGGPASIRRESPASPLGGTPYRRTAPGAGDVRPDARRQLVANASRGARSLRQPTPSRKCRNWQAGAGDVGELTLWTAGCWPCRLATGRGGRGTDRAGTGARVAYPARSLQHRGPPAISADGAPGFHPEGGHGAGGLAAHCAAVDDEEARRASPPGPTQVRAIEEAVLARWQPRIRARRRAQAETEGFVFRTRARFGFAAPAGSSEDPRVRWITQDLPGEVARELFAARDAGVGEQQQTVILARALGHAYFREWGRRAHGLHIAFSDVEFADFSIA